MNYSKLLWDRSETRSYAEGVGGFKYLITAGVGQDKRFLLQIGEHIHCHHYNRDHLERMSQLHHHDLHALVQEAFDKGYKVANLRNDQENAFRSWLNK